MTAGGFLWAFTERFKWPPGLGSAAASAAAIIITANMPTVWKSRKRHQPPFLGPEESASGGTRRVNDR